MRRLGTVLFMTLMFALSPMVVHGEEPYAGELDKEAIVQDITMIAGYEEEARERKFRIIDSEFEPGSGKACFVAAYYGITAELSWDKRTAWYGDVWAVKDGVYTEVLEDVELNGASAGMKLLDMDGRSFLLIHTRNNDERGTIWYDEDEILLYSFCDGEPTCYLSEMTDYKYNCEEQLLTAYFLSPITDFNFYHHANKMNTQGFYNKSAYFFYCEDGELKEIVAEPVEDEEYWNADLEGSGWGELDVYDRESKEKTFYHIPGIGYYTNVVSWGKDEENGDDAEAVLCRHVLHGYREPKLYSDSECIVGPFGYRYTSWLNREEEEKELCAKVEERIGRDMRPKLEAENAERKAVTEAKFGRTEYAGIVPVRQNDSLWKIAERCCGNGEQWIELYEKNRDIIGDNPSLICPGMTLRLK